MRKISIKPVIFILSIGLFILCIGSSCQKMETITILDEQPALFPDYLDVVIPPNIAPINFNILETSERYRVRFVAGSDSFEISCNRHVNIPAKKWKKLLAANGKKNLSIRIFAQKERHWQQYRDLSLFIAAEPVDPYIAYRLIKPGYEYWDQMGIYQRHVESFDETPVMVNTLTGGSCMNCHAFCKNDPQKMLFHNRVNYAGTILVNNGQISKLNTKTANNISAAVYPRWHPQGRYIAFSTNKTSQAFHSVHPNLVEVYDSASDLVIYDTETNTLSSHPYIHATQRLETFPEWSPDGRYLYFCSASALKMPENFDSLRYDLFRIDFDPATGKTGAKLQYAWQPSQFGKSVAFPRISPDGRYMVVCLSDYGTFPIWHHETDLYLLDLESGVTAEMTTVNSPESDSYHSWSSNGRWLIFASRRLDGRHTRLFITYFDAAGNFYKPFLLPQKEPQSYEKSLKSYNVPEFITGKIKTNIRTFERAIKGQSSNVIVLP